MTNSLNEQDRATNALRLMTERREQESAGERARRNAEISADIEEETRARRAAGLPLGRLIRDCEPGTVIMLDPRPYRFGRQ